MAVLDGLFVNQVPAEIARIVWVAIKPCRNCYTYSLHKIVTEGLDYSCENNELLR